MHATHWTALAVGLIALAAARTSLWLGNSDETTLGDLQFQECSLTTPRQIRHLRCAFFDVPENYQEPDGRQISLFVARLPARSVTASPDPVLAFAGGPGQAASESFLRLDQQLLDLSRERDIYLIDQRGTGLSQPQHCNLENQDETFLQPDSEALREAVRQCLTNLDGDPRQYTTSVAVRDFEAVRQALGVERWNLFGVSYGTRVAQHYMRQYPERVRTTVLDGVIPSKVNLGPDIALRSQDALQAFFDYCASDTACHQQYPDLQTTVDTLLQRLDKEAVTAQYENLKTGRRTTMTFTHTHLVSVIRMALYNSDVLSILPPMLHQANARNNFAALARLATQLNPDSRLAMGMHNAVACTEDVPFYDEDLPHEKIKTTYMGTLIVDALTQVCDEWPIGVMDENLKQPLESNIPTLLLSGEHDPITPPAYGRQVQKNLTLSTHLIAPGQGHNVSFSGCMPRIIAQFVETANPHALSTDCLARLKAAPVFMNVNGPSP